METNTDILSGYIRDHDFAATYNISTRTIWRYRQAGLPYVIFGGEVWINAAGARQWLESRERRRNHPTSSQRRRLARTC
jgi:hypothetical protein